MLLSFSFSAEAHVEQRPKSSDLDVSIDSDGSGPPAALRKWQRQRPPSDFVLDSEDVSQNFYNQMRLSGSYHRHNE